MTRVREELANEGFGVLCEIDVQATLKQKLGIDREPYLILGACNPPLAHAALEAEPELGVLLPCNVVVYEQHGQTHIAAVDAEQMLSIVGNDELAGTASEVQAASIRRGRPRRPELSRHGRMNAAPAGAQRCSSPVSRRSLPTRPRPVSPTANWCSSTSAKHSRSIATG